MDGLRDQQIRRRQVWIGLVDSNHVVTGIGRPDLARRDVFENESQSESPGKSTATLYSGFIAIARNEPNSSLCLWIIRLCNDIED